MTILYAIDIAERMGSLADFPRAAKAVAQVGELIHTLCATEAQADWLLAETTMTGKYRKWEGPGWLREIYEAKFAPKGEGKVPSYSVDKSNATQMTPAEEAEWQMQNEITMRRAKENVRRRQQGKPAVQSMHKVTAIDLAKLSPAGRGGN